MNKTLNDTYNSLRETLRKKYQQEQKILQDKQKQKVDEIGKHQTELKNKTDELHKTIEQQQKLEIAKRKEAEILAKLK